MKKILIISTLLMLLLIAGRYVKNKYDEAMEQYDTAQHVKELIDMRV